VVVVVVVAATATGEADWLNGLAGLNRVNTNRPT
jgi:hypothetical protein